MTIEVKVKCDDCDEDAYFTDDIEFVCDECKEKNIDIELKALIERLILQIEEGRKMTLSHHDDLSLKEFKDEKEKYDFSRGVNYGYQDSIHWITMISKEYGINMNVIYKPLEKKWKEEKRMHKPKNIA